MRTSLLFRTLIVALVLLAGGLAFANQVAVGNQQGPGVNERTENLIGLCRLNFGIEDVTPVRTPGAGLVGTKVLCIGGPLDGLTCYISKNATVCDWKTVGAESQPAGSVQEVTTVNQDLIFVSELPTDSLSPLSADVASEPMVVEAVITWNPSAEAATEAGVVQVNACRMLGGTEAVATAGGNLESTSFTVLCQEGILDGMWCSLGVGLNSCFFLPESTPAESVDMPAATTVPTIPQDDTDPTPTATATATAPAPTATVPSPDDPVIEPTFVDPTVEPTLPMFEPFDPTPTPVILT